MRGSAISHTSADPHAHPCLSPFYHLLPGAEEEPGAGEHQHAAVGLRPPL